MKQLNFFSKRQTCSHNVVTLASTVGSPSAHRRGAMLKLISVLALILTIGVGQMWGAIASGTYVLCTSTSDLEANAHYIIANGTSETVKCISNVSNSNNRKTVEATVSSSKISVASNSTIMTFTLGGSSGAWTFHTDNYAGTNGYLASASNDKNYCRVISTVETATISFSNNKATIALTPHSSRKYLKYNANNGDPLFACYSSGQSDVYLYKLVTLSSIAVKTAPTKVSYTEGENFDPTGLVIRLTYSDNSTEDVTYNGTTASNFTFSPTTSTSLTTSHISVSITYGGKSTSQAITVAASGCTNNINIIKGSESHGTFTLDKDGSQATCSGLTVVVTPDAADHYHVASVSATTGETGSDNGDGTWTITYAENSTGSSTINVVFAEDKKYTLNYHDGSGDDTKTNVYEGTNLITALGSPAASCDATSTTFVGWSTTNITTKTNTAPTFVAENAIVNSTTAAEKYYAVYAKSDGGSFDGTNGGTFKIYAQVGENKYYATGSGSKISSTTTASDGASYTFTKVTDGDDTYWTIKYGNNYITYSSSTNLGTSTDPYNWTITSSSHGSWHLESGTSGRGFIYQDYTTNSNNKTYTRQFGGYSSNNVDGDDYFDVEIGGSTSFKDYICTCCTPLASINGSVTLSNLANPEEGKLKAEWQLAGTTGIGSLTLELWKKGETDTKVSTDAVTINTNAQSKTYTGLDHCATYYVKLIAAKDDGTYCTNGWEETSNEATTIGYAITLPANGKVMDDQTELGTVTASASRACAGDEVTLSATPTSPYTGGVIVVRKTSDNTDVTSTYFNAGTGKLTMPAFGVTISATFTAPSAPSVSATGNDLTETTLAFGEQEINTTSSSKTFTISGLNLTGDVTWAKGGTNASEFTVTSPESGTIAQATAANGQAFTVTFTPTSAGTKTATLTFSTAGEDKLVIALSGTGVNLYTVTLNLGGGKDLGGADGWAYDNVNKVYTQKQASNGASITLPDATLSSGLSTAGWSFAGWKTEAVSSKTGDAQTFVNTDYIPTNDITLYAVYNVNAGGTVTDEIDLTFTGQSGTTYGSWSSKKGSASDAVYAGSSAGGNSSVQLRSTNNSGIITTASGGKAKKVTVTWNSNTATDRTLDIYGKNTAYSATSDLHSSESATQGTKLGSIVNGTSTELTISGDYAYIGLRSNNGAMYLDKVQIEWSTASYSYFSNPSDKVSITYDANGGENAPAKQENITIGSNPTTATIGSMEKEGHTFSKWNTKADGTGTDYSAGGTITNISTDLTLYAIWTINKHTVAVSSVDNGTITATPAGASAIAEGSSNTEVAYGTVVTLAQTNDTHYTFGTWTVMAGETPLEVENNQFTMPDADVTISANFTENAKRTVKFYKDGTAIQSEDVYVGETPSAPSPEAPVCFGESNTFAGWSPTPWTGTDNNPAGLITTLPAVVAGEDAISYHAVFCKNNEASALFSWAGGSSANLTALNNVNANSLGTTDYDANNHSPYLVKFDGTGDYIDITTTAVIDYVTVGVKMIGGNTASSITVKESANGTEFSDVQTLSISGAQNSTHELSTTQAFATTSRVVRLYFTKGANVGVGPITIMGAASKSNYMTTCLLDLGAINGTVGLEKLTSGENAGKLQASWTMASKDGLADNGIIIKIYKDGETPTLVKTSAALSKDATSYVATDLTPDYCSEYYATLTPVKVDNTYKDGVEQGKSASNCVVGAQYTYTGYYSHVAPKEGEIVAENSCSSFSVKFEGTESYTLPDEISVIGVSTYTWENDILSFDKANVTGDVTITINGVAPAVTTLSATPTALDFGTPAKDEIVTAKTFRISGVALSAGTITITSPNAGFTVSPESIVVGAGTLEASEATEITVTPVTSTVGEFDGNITISGGGASTTVALTMEVKNQYAVNWYVNGVKQEESATYLDGATINKPVDPESCDASISFMGWTTATIDGKQQSAPETLLAASEITTATASVDYYAVFAKPGEATWTQTALADLTASDIFVIVGNNGSNYAMTNDNGTTHPLATSVSIENNMITSAVADNLKWNVSGNATDGYTFYPNGNSAKWLYCTNANDGVKVGTGDAKVFTLNSGYLYTTQTTDNRYIGIYNSADWRCYTSNTGTSNIKSQTFAFYKYASSAASDYMTTCSIAYSVTYQAGTGTGNDYVVNDIAKNAPHTVLGNNTTNFTKEHYHFTGWKLDDVNYAPEDVIEHVTADLTFVAQWERNTFTMSYNANGGSVQEGKEALANDIVNDGEPYTVKANVYEQANKLFAGWKVGNVDYAEGAEFTPTSNMEFVAQWADIAICAISFQVNGQQVTSVNAPQGSAYAIPEIANLPEVTGFTFEGWSETEVSDEVEEMPTIITSYTPAANEENKVLYGIYSRLDKTGDRYGKYERATAVAEGEYLIVCEEKSVVFDGSLTSLDVAGNKKDVTIDNGILTLENADNYVFTIAEVTNGYSIKSKSGYYIGRTANSNGFNSSTTEAYAHTITLTEDNFAITSSVGPKLQYYLDGANSRFRYYTSTQKAIALYKKNTGTTKYTSSPVEKVTITFNTNGGNGGCTSVSIVKGVNFTICDDIPTKSHQVFDGWKLNETATIYQAGASINTVTASITLTAQWSDAPTYTVTYNVNGSNDAAPIQAEQYAGDKFTMAAGVTRNGYTFKGWLFNNKLYKAGTQFTMPAENVVFVDNWKKNNISTEKMTLVTDANALVNGLEFALGCSYGDNNFAMAGDITGTNGFMNSVSGEGISLSGDIASFTSDVITLIAEQVEGGWKLRKDADHYLTLNSSSNIEWNSQDNATTWTISFSNGNVNIQSGNNKLQFNSTSPRFKTYASNQTAIQMFSKATVVTTTVNISDLGNMSEEAVVVSGNVTLTIDVPTTTTSITASSGATVVIDAETTTESVVVEEGCKVVVNEQTTTPIVQFSATMGSEKKDDNATTSEIENADNIVLEEGGEIQYDITLSSSLEGGQADPNHWHAFTVPFEVDPINGVYNAATDTKLTNEVHYAIMEYDGSRRANGQYGWKKVRSTLTPGKFYLMTVDGTVTTFRFKKKVTVQTALPNHTSMEYVAYSGSGADGDQGWNGIGNPSWLGGKVGYSVQILDPYTYTFVTKPANSTNFRPSTPFFYKAALGGTMSMITNNNQSSAPRRTPAKEIDLLTIRFGNDVYKDKLYIAASEDALNEYENDKDLIKMIMSNTPKVAQIFGKAYGMKLSMVNMPLVNDQAEVAIQLYAPANGTYTIEAPAIENASVYLTFEGSIIWDLTMSAYELDLDKGTTEGYGLIMQAKAPQITTGISGTDAEAAGVQKVVINDHVYILRGGEMYDVTGKAVK